jgi:ABC-2 type transport system permease protein
MAHPLLYDIRKIFLSKTVLISMLMLIAISFFLIYSFSASTGSTFQSSNSEVLSWYDTAGTYHFFLFETNQFGQPVSGVSIQANLTVSPFSYVSKGPITNPTSYPVYQSPLVSTNSTGETEFTIKVPISEMNEVNANYTFLAKISQPDGFATTYGGGMDSYSEVTGSANGTITSVQITPGAIVDLTRNSIITVTDSSNAQKGDVMVTWAGSNGSVPNDYSLYYKFINESETCTQTQFGGSCTSSVTMPSNLNETDMTFLGNMTSFQQIFSPPKLEPNLGNASQIDFSLFFPNGTAAIPSQNNALQVSQLYTTPQTFNLGQTNQIVFSFFTTIYGIFIPLIAIIGSYNSYGKDRVSGVLESILAQPVSRLGLSLSRFLSSFVAMAIAIAISMGVVDAIVLYYTHSLLNGDILLASAGAFFVELAAFIGIMMLLSRVVRSSGALIGIGIGLFIVFDFLWSVLIILVLSLTRTSYNSAGYLGYVIGAEFLNPAQFVGLVNTYLTGQSTLGLISPSKYGITIPSLVATGIIWAVIPLVGFLYLAIKKD